MFFVKAVNAIKAMIGSFVGVGFLTFIIGVSCLLAYRIKGAYVAADGTLIESFWLIPVGFLFLLLSLVSVIIGLFRRYCTKK